MNAHNIWLYGDYRVMRVGIGNDTGRSDCKYYHVLTMNLGAESPQWRKLSGGGNYAHNEIDKAEQEMREKLHGDIHQLTDHEAYKLFGLEHSHDVYHNPPADRKQIWDAIMKPVSGRKEVQVKTRNNRCPLQQECERTCKYIGQEHNCDYYHNNCLPGMEIDGQEVNDNADAPDVPQSLSVAEAASLEADAPLAAFDYAALDDATAQELHGISDMVMELNRNYAWGMANAVGRAHDLLCGKPEACLTVRQAKAYDAQGACSTEAQAQNIQEAGACTTVRQARNNQYSENTFTAWCISMGLTRPTAYNLLNAYRVISTATHTEQDVLQNAPAALLYAAGKKDAPEQLVDAVKSGDITTNAEYQRLLTKMEAARNAADVAEQRARGLEDSYRTAHKNEEYAIKRVQEAEKERDGARQALQTAKLRGDKLREENEALKARPIEVKSVDPDEIERRAAQRARELSEPLQEQIRQLQEDLTRAPQGAVGEDNANRLYDQIVLAKRTIESVWGIARETLCQLPDEMRSGARQLMRETLQKITEEL